MNFTFKFQSVVLVVLFTCALELKAPSVINENIDYFSNQDRLQYGYGCTENTFGISKARTSRTKMFMQSLRSPGSHNYSNQGREEDNNRTEDSADPEESSRHSRILWDEYGEEEVQFNPRARTDAYKVGRPEDTPYSVLLNMHRVSGVKAGACTGSLLTLEWVLTAAHCLNIPKVVLGSVLVYAGGNSEAELLLGNLAPGGQERRSTQFYPHPRYKPEVTDYDVGVVKVESPFQESPTVQVVKLSNQKWPYFGYHSCTLAGFGAVHYGRKHEDDGKRKEHQLDMKSPCICQWRLKQLMGYKTASKLVCSRPLRDYGVCPGDSGGGIVCDGELRAVVSAMIKVNPKNLCQLEILGDFVCGSQYGLNLFMNTCPFVRWINKHVALYNQTEISDKCYDWGTGGSTWLKPMSYFTLILLSCTVHYIFSIAI